MNHFNLGSLRNWQQVATGQMLAFDVPAAGHRSVAVEFMADSFVSVHAIAGDEFWLVACGSGHLSTKFATDVSVAIVVMGDKEADVFMRTHVETQVVPESEDTSFTTIEMRAAGPSEEVKRMMHLMKINEKRREKALNDQLQAMREAATPPAPPAPPAPPPAASEAPVEPPK